MNKKVHILVDDVMIMCMLQCIGSLREYVIDIIKGEQFIRLISCNHSLRDLSFLVDIVRLPTRMGPFAGAMSAAKR